MKILAVDAGLCACSCAIIEDAKILEHKFVAMERGHAEALAPMVRDCLTFAQLSIGAIDRLAVTTGPGTFTGQRVGLAFMRGLRVALKKPLTGVTTLKAMAVQAMAETEAQAAVAIHDARRGEIYFEIAGAPEIAAHVQLANLPDAAAVIDNKFAQFQDRLVFCGTAAEAMLSVCAPHVTAMLSAIRQPDALWVAKLALQSNADVVPQPLYLRPPDAKLPKASA